MVKQDLNLKSCLSQTSSKVDQSLPPPPTTQQPETTPHLEQHPQFVSTDDISPNQHGLAPGSQIEEYTPIGFNSTPLISSQGSVTSSLVSPPPSTKPAMSPPIFTPLLSNLQLQQHQLHHQLQQPPSQQHSQPGVSRMNLLTYSLIDDKNLSNRHDNQLIHLQLKLNCTTRMQSLHLMTTSYIYSLASLGVSQSTKTSFSSLRNYLNYTLMKNLKFKYS